jgi:hypothetical protein
MRWVARRLLLALPLLIAMGTAQPAAAQTTIDESGTVLLFPSLVGVGAAADPLDQLISLANVSNDLVYVRCFYLTAADCSVADEFNLSLTRQQPTQWSVRRGRPVDTSDPQCSGQSNSCANAGLDPGPIPAKPDFTGALICVETNSADQPIGGNHLVGSLTQSGPLAGDSGHYEAVRLRATEALVEDNVLCLGDQSGAGCPVGGDLEACPASWLLVHDAAVGDGQTSPRESTAIAFLPCDIDLNGANPAELDIRVSIYNEFEQLFTDEVTVSCAGSLNLTDRFSAETLGTPSLQTELTSLDPGKGFIPVANRDRVIAGTGAWQSIELSNLHHRGVTANSTDRIQLPTPEVAP